MDDVRIIRPPSRIPKLDLGEVLRSRELLWVFVRRGIFARYRQMALGIFWSLLEPLGLLIMMSVVFGMILRVPTGGFPYPIFVFSALIPWLYFSKAVNGTASSLHENIAIISKIYFPRVLLPLSALMREMFDSLMLFVLLVVLAWIYGFPPSWKLLLMPIVLLYLSIPALGIGLSVAAISIRYRDFRPMLALVLQAGFYVTPILYPVALVPEIARPIYMANPVYWGVEFSRWIILDQPMTLHPSLIVSLLICAGLLIAGYYIFASYEREAVDVQ